MLVLTRKRRQGIWIGDSIHVTVLEVEHGRVKLGIEAPPDMEIDRDEIRERTPTKKDVDPST